MPPNLFLPLRALVWCVALVLGSQPSAAADFVVVLDQSGSMERTPPKSDPSRIRYDAALLCIDFARASDRVALIDFTGEAQVLFPLTRMTLDAKKRAREAVEASRARYADGATNLFAALKAGADVIAASNLGEASSRDVLLLTDGKHSPDSRGEQPLVGTKPFDEAIERLRALHAHVYVIALGREADREFAQAAASGTGGAVYEVVEAKQLLRFYVDILVASQSLLRIRANDFTVLPGAERICVAGFENERGARLGQVLVNGDPVGVAGGTSAWSSRERHGQNLFYDLLVKQEPAIGKWSVRPLPGHSTVVHVLQEIPAEFEVLAPEGQIAAGAEAPLCLRVKPRPGRKSEIETLVRLMKGNVRIGARGGAAVGEAALSLQASPPAGEGFDFVGRWPAKQAGHYTATFVLSINNFTGTSGEPIWTYERERAFDVIAPDYQIRILSPQGGAVAAAPDSLLPVKVKIEPWEGRMDRTSLPADLRLMGQIQGPGGAAQNLDFQADASRTWNGSVRVSYPGDYKFRVEGSAPGYTFVPDELAFSVGEKLIPTPEHLRLVATLAETDEFRMQVVGWLRPGATIWAQPADDEPVGKSVSALADRVQVATRLVTAQALPAVTSTWEITLNLRRGSWNELRRLVRPWTGALLLGSSSDAHVVLARVPLQLEAKSRPPELQIRTNLEALPPVGASYVVVMNSDVSPSDRLGTRYFTMGVFEVGDGDSRLVTPGASLRNGSVVRDIRWSLHVNDEKARDPEDNQFLLTGTEAQSSLRSEAFVVFDTGEPERRDFTITGKARNSK